MYGSEEGQRELAQELKKFMVRRLTDDVWKDAPKGEVGQVWVPLSNRTEYQMAEADFIKWLQSRGASDEQLSAAERGKALVKINMLRKLAALGKIPSAINMMGKTMDAGEQVVAFCAFNDPLFRMAEEFRSKRGINYKGQTWSGSDVIVGKVLEKQRLKIIDAFQAGQIGWLGIGTKAGGMGIDLPIACYGYFLDLPWTPADFTQCSGRLLRLGQERDCQFIKLLAKNSVDQRLEEIIQAKAGIFERAIDDKKFVDRILGRDPRFMRQTVVSALIASYFNG
jgi:SWI/SNF-related matrix-associated actin-dependent regulator 1 of chromatin subfamily A